MHILWLCNVPLPEASVLMNEKPTPFGGWLVSLSQSLSTKEDITLSVAFPNAEKKDVTIINGKSITYYAFPSFSYQNCVQIFKKIIQKTTFDVIHIWGTEFSHTLAMVEASKECGHIDKVVISIQGLCSVYAKHYFACLPENITSSYSFRDFVTQENIKQQKQKFIKRGEFEIKAIQNVKQIIGRTTWDKACIMQINPDASYRLCNEMLRDPFYKNKWDINKCVRHSIFVSQGNYPIKGLHFLLEALYEISKLYPNVHLYVAGTDEARRGGSFIDELKKTYYGKYLNKLIDKYELENHVTFLGILDENEMCQHYLKAHVFVLASSIENSPNSLGEAMILGVPCVSSCVGGVQDMLTDKIDGYTYPFDEPYMLSYYICNIFQNDDIANDFSNNSHAHAAKTHNKTDIIKQLLVIYNDISAI